MSEDAQAEASHPSTTAATAAPVARNNSLVAVQRDTIDKKQMSSDAKRTNDDKGLKASISVKNQVQEQLKSDEAKKKGAEVLADGKSAQVPSMLEVQGDQTKSTIAAVQSAAVTAQAFESSTKTVAPAVVDSKNSIKSSTIAVVPKHDLGTVKDAIATSTNANAAAPVSAPTAKIASSQIEAKPAEVVKTMAATVAPAGAAIANPSVGVSKMQQSTTSLSAKVALGSSKPPTAGNNPPPTSKPINAASGGQSITGENVMSTAATTSATKILPAATAVGVIGSNEKPNPIPNQSASTASPMISIPGTIPQTAPATTTTTATAASATIAPVEPPTFAITSQIDNLPQNILTLLQTYGPLTAAELSYNLPLTPSSAQSIPSILKIMVTLGVINHQDSLGLYYFHQGDIRGDTVYPKDVIETIQDTQDEIRESMERIQLLEKELNRPVKKQRSRSAREFLKDLAAKYDGERGIRGDTVYATALRTLNVDLGLKRKIAAQDTGKKKRKKRNRNKDGSSGDAGAEGKRKRKNSSSATASSAKNLKKSEEGGSRKVKKQKVQIGNMGLVKENKILPQKVEIKSKGGARQASEIQSSPTVDKFPSEQVKAAVAVAASKPPSNSTFPETEVTVKDTVLNTEPAQPKSTSNPTPIPGAKLKGSGDDQSQENTSSSGMK